MFSAEFSFKVKTALLSAAVPIIIRTKKANTRSECMEQDNHIMKVVRRSSFNAHAREYYCKLLLTSTLKTPFSKLIESENFVNALSAKKRRIPPEYEIDLALHHPVRSHDIYFFFLP